MSSSYDWILVIVTPGHVEIFVLEKKYCVAEVCDTRFVCSTTLRSWYKCCTVCGSLTLYIYIYSVLETRVHWQLPCV